MQAQPLVKFLCQNSHLPGATGLQPLKGTNLQKRAEGGTKQIDVGLGWVTHCQSHSSEAVESITDSPADPCLPNVRTLVSWIVNQEACSTPMGAFLCGIGAAHTHARAHTHRMRCQPRSSWFIDRPFPASGFQELSLRCVKRNMHPEGLDNVMGSKNWGTEAACRSTKRSTHARPGVHMQQCSAVLKHHRHRGGWGVQRGGGDFIGR